MIFIKEWLLVNFKVKTDNILIKILVWTITWFSIEILSKNFHLKMIDGKLEPNPHFKINQDIGSSERLVGDSEEEKYFLYIIFVTNVLSSGPWTFYIM